MDWPMFRHVERRANRMADVMQRLDVDTMKLVRLRSGEAFAEARKTCIECANSRECLAWLDGKSTRDELPAFCPNLALFESCKKSSPR